MDYGSNSKSPKNYGIKGKGEKNSKSINYKKSDIIDINDNGDSDVDTGGHPDTKTQEKITKARATLDEVKIVMLDNIDKVIERGETLDSIENKSRELEANSKKFYRSAIKLKRQMWYKNLKIIGCITFFIVLVAVAIVLIVHYSSYTIKG
jgi:vesicle-associated membrane protein 4